MASINITITLQAASDSVMTLNNNPEETAFVDDDCRKVYGLPHTYVANGAVKDVDGIPLGRVQIGEEEVKGSGSSISSASMIRPVYGQLDVGGLIINDADSMNSGQLKGGNTGARWDEISPTNLAMLHTEYMRAGQIGDPFPEFSRVGGYGINDVSITDMISQACLTFPIDRRPTTTAFQLHCDTLSHVEQDMASITPLPGVEWGSGPGNLNSGTPEQLDNISVGLGFRNEKITLGGVMLDRGIVSANNPRRQILLNIARTQYLKIRNAAAPSTAKQVEDGIERGRLMAWGGIYAGPTNPRSYPCLVLSNQAYDSYTSGNSFDPGDGTDWRPSQGDVEPDGAYKIYRGLITQMSFSMEPGRPDFWRWSMDFSVLANEKRGIGEVNEVSVMAGPDGEGDGQTGQ
ncbi:hypothetical protein [uncultured virus]|uniref:Uncharacterized protein n=1 Tax=uncultured virus TaxID=340016 RepID=A0A218MKZ3_9VIRU|nr:hypothetical protein [uncultured virus]